MDFDVQWLLLGLPFAFGLGWLASRFDLRQWKRDQRDTPNAYFRGLNLLLNEQQDKAIDAFIEAVQRDPDTSDLHFALGNLFRRRGEFERAVRVHQHLLNRADLTPADRDRAQHGLAQDYMKAGLFDRAEEAWSALQGTDFDTDARLALLTLHERSRDWRAAIDDAQQLERGGAGSYQSRVAHYWCEIAADADAAGQTSDADAAVHRARAAAPQSARPMIVAGERARAAANLGAAVACWEPLQTLHPDVFGLVAVAYAESAQRAGIGTDALAKLEALYARNPSVDLLRALAVLDADPQRTHDRLVAAVQRHGSLSAAGELLRSIASRADAGLQPDLQRVEQTVARAATPLQRYRCAACGFETQHYFWQCPGCMHWDSYPAQRLEELG